LAGAAALLWFAGESGGTLIRSHQLARICRDSFTCVRDFIEKIDFLVAHHNCAHGPFVWTATAGSILQRIARLCSRVFRAATPVFRPWEGQGFWLHALIVMRYPECALAVLPPRFSSPGAKCRCAAMYVQYNAVESKRILHIVLYCLTPPEFRRYSSLNSCPPYPAWGENIAQGVFARGRTRQLIWKRNLPDKHPRGCVDARPNHPAAHH